MLEIHKNKHNDFVHNRIKSSIPLNRLYPEQIRFSQKLMVSSSVSWHSKTIIHCIDSKYTKMNSDCDIKWYEENLMPDCQSFYLNNSFILEQDDATSHNASQLTQNYISSRNITFIKKWLPTMVTWHKSCGLRSSLDIESLYKAVYLTAGTKFHKKKLEKLFQHGRKDYASLFN